MTGKELIQQIKDNNAEGKEILMQDAEGAYFPISMVESDPFGDKTFALIPEEEQFDEDSVEDEE